MQARKNLLAVLASSAALTAACGDDDEGDTVIIVECGGAGGEDHGGAPGSAGAPDAGAPSEGGAGAAPAAGAGGEAGTPATSTSLRVIIVDRPAAADASVSVRGPGGFSAIISASTTFHDLEPGDYSVLAPPARVDGALVDELFGAAISDDTPAVALAQVVEVTVDYSATRLGGSGMLWASNSANHQLLGYSAAQMALDGDVAEEPSVNLTLPALGSADALPGPIAFDPLSGRLWVGYCGTGTPQAIAAFEPASLAESGQAQAAITLEGPAEIDRACVTGLAFDALGNLWVGFYANWFVRYTRAQIATSGAPVPDASFYATSLGGLQDLAFDSAGNLLVSAWASGNVQKFLPATLVQSSAEVPSAVSWLGAAINGPTGLALDASGNLWIAHYGNSQLSALDPLAQAMGGNPATIASISSADVNGPQFIAFDEGGNLWVSVYDDSRLVRLDAADLDSVPPVDAAAAYTNANLDAPYSVRLNPPANGN